MDCLLGGDGTAEAGVIGGVGFALLGVEGDDTVIMAETQLVGIEELVGVLDRREGHLTHEIVHGAFDAGGLEQRDRASVEDGDVDVARHVFPIAIIVLLTLRDSDTKEGAACWRKCTNIDELHCLRC